MSPIRRSWIWFTLCSVVAVSAVGWIGWTALRLERVSQKEADREENVRLALWRMESVLAPLIAEEASRPAFGYPVLDPAGNPVPSTLDNTVLATAPIPSSRSPYVQMQFRILPSGSTNFSVPLTQRANPDALVSTVAIEGAGARLSLEGLEGRLPPPLPSDSEPLVVDEPTPADSVAFQQDVTQTEESPFQSASQMRQTMRNDLEVQARSRRIRSATYGYNATPQQAGTIQLETDSSPELAFGALTPVWLKSDLVLARRVRLNGLEHIQGSWLDWPKLRESLLDEVRDLLPEAHLVPMLDTGADRLDAHSLAALPIRLIPGALASVPPAGFTPLRVSLLIAWICVALAGGAVAILLAGALSLSERRRDFVSAVSHELRTPLTTFRMYTEMLANDMIPDEKKKRRYLDKLTVEADRLSHLVENVLAYAKLDGRRSQSRLTTHRVEEIIASQEGRLEDHAQAGGLQLRIAYGAGARDAEIRLDPSSLEQILFNLVDNATKYGRPTQSDRSHEPPCVALHISLTPDSVLFDIRDSGPGIPADERRRLFQPFTKSDTQAARSAPGVGLGLAICRRLARAMNGELTVEPAPVGAHFRLRLPR